MTNGSIRKEEDDQPLVRNLENEQNIQDPEARNAIVAINENLRGLELKGKQQIPVNINAGKNIQVTKTGLYDFVISGDDPPEASEADVADAGAGGKENKLPPPTTPLHVLATRWVYKAADGDEKAGDLVDPTIPYDEDLHTLVWVSDWVRGSTDAPV